MQNIINSSIDIEKFDGQHFCILHYLLFNFTQQLDNLVLLLVFILLFSSRSLKPPLALAALWMMAFLVARAATIIKTTK